MTKLFQRLLKNGSIFFFIAGFSVLLVYSAVRAPAPEFGSETIVEFPRQDEETIRTRRENRPIRKELRRFHKAMMPTIPIKDLLRRTLYCEVCALSPKAAV